MDALDQSDKLIRRGGELRARSERIRAAADEKMETSTRLISTAAEAREIMMHARGWKPAGRTMVLSAATGGC